MKKLTLTVFVLMLLTLLFSINIYATEERATIEYKTGAQIELYLKSDSSCELTSFASSGYVSYTVGDESIAVVKNGNLTAKKAGLTYISFNYGNYIINYNVIVHSGYKSIQYVNINGNNISSSNKASVNLYVGETYDLLINNDSDFDFYNLKIQAFSKYKEVSADEFVRIDKEGKLHVVGMGPCDLVIKLSTNKTDPGIRIQINSNFENSALNDASLKFFNDNGYELACTGYDDQLFMTATELSIINTLTLTSLQNYSNEKLDQIFPNLKKVAFDLSNSNTTLGSFTIKNDKFEYQFIGNPEKTYSLDLKSDKRDSLKIHFNNFNYSSSQTALNLENVSNAVVSFNGKCSIKANEASYNYIGYSAIVASSLSIELAKESDVTIRGGKGGSSSVYNNTHYSRQGGNGIKAKNLSITVNGYSESTTLYIYGGDGGNGYNYGDAGGAGNAGVSTESLSVSGILSCNVYGGNGGNGKAGKDDYSYASAVGSVSAGEDGKKGNTGSKGQTGGSGGNGAAAISTISIDKAIGIKLVLIGGNGGDGAKGGRGQNGGTGGKGGNNKNDDAGNGGKGGTGGEGGNGGSAGEGALAINISKIDYLYSLTNTSMIHGYGGNAGSGGNGGTGGKGGNGGDDKHGSFLVEGPEQGSGGNPGDGGKGGSVGDSATEVRILGLANIDESIAKNPSVTNPTVGSNGGIGSSGSSGDNGSWP